MPVAKRKQQRGGSVMILAGIVNQTINGPSKDDEGLEQNSAFYCDFMDKNFLTSYKSQ